MALREVLFLVYHFPPLGMGGVQRPLKFVKYLPLWGWRPIVLTVKPIQYYASDATLLREIPGEVEVFRAGSLDPFRVSRILRPGASRGSAEVRPRTRSAVEWLAVPDLYWGWLPFAVRAGLAIIRSRPIEAVFATAPPYTTHLIGDLLARATKTPLVLDYRDAWTFDSPRAFPTRWHRSLNRFLEGRTLKGAARVLAVNREIARGLCDGLSLAERDKVRVLPLGYDPDDFMKAKATQPSKFRISHVGTLIGERSTKPLLSALQELLKGRPELRGSLEVRFVGQMGSENREMIQATALEDVVTCIPYLPHDESLAELLSAHALYLVIGAGEGKTISTGKLYEYLGSRKPILASAPSCEASRTVAETRAGRVFHPDDPTGLAGEILRLYQGYQRGDLCGPPLEVVQRYDRRELARELACHLSDVA